MPIRWNAARRYHPSIFSAIGRTPLVQLNRIPAAAGVKAKILVKVEYFSPSGSLKDRIYWNMFERAERRGALKKGMTVLECSTGNAGIGCSFVSAVKGYPCIIVMPEGMSEERKKLDVAYGAQMVYTPGGESDVDLALEKLESIRRQKPRKYFVPAQFENPDNIDAHIRTTGPEIWEQTAGRMDAFIMTQGTGGTLTGVGRYIRKRKKALRLFAIEPAECPLLSRRQWGPHGIEGHRRRLRAEEPRRQHAQRHRDDDHRRIDGHGAPPGQRGRHLLRRVVGRQRRGRDQAGERAPGTQSHRDAHLRHRAAILLHGAVRQPEARRDPGARPPDGPVHDEAVEQVPEGVGDYLTEEGFEQKPEGLGIRDSGFELKRTRCSNAFSLRPAVMSAASRASCAISSRPGR